jgi:hypothetical protein
VSDIPVCKLRRLTIGISVNGPALSTTPGTAIGIPLTRALAYYGSSILIIVNDMPS